MCIRDSKYGNKIGGKGKGLWDPFIKGYDKNGNPIRWTEDDIRNTFMQGEFPWKTPQNYQGGDDPGGYGYGYGYGGGGGSGGYGYGYGEDEDPMARGYQRGKVGPGGLLEAVNKLLFRISGLNKKRGGIVSLLELS